jgi:hypothetical protein
MKSSKEYKSVQATFKVLTNHDKQGYPIPYVEGAEDGTIRVGETFTIVLPPHVSPSYERVYFMFNTAGITAGIYIRLLDFVSGETTRLVVTPDVIIAEKPFKVGDVATVESFLDMRNVGWVWGEVSVPYTFIS